MNTVCCVCEPDRVPSRRAAGGRTRGAWGNSTLLVSSCALRPGTGRGPCLGGADPCALGEMNEFGHGLHLHFFHDAGAMDFDGFLDGAEVSGGLLVELAGDDVFQDFALARSERRQALLDFGDFGTRLPLEAILLDGDVNGFEQILVVHRFGEEIQSAALHRLHAHGDVAVAGEKNDGKLAAFRRQSLLQLQAIQAGHRDVEHETAGGAAVVSFKELPGRTERGDVKPGRAQQAREAFQHGGIVVHYKNCGKWRGVQVAGGVISNQWSVISNQCSVISGR